MADNLIAGMEWSFANSEVKAIDTMLIKGGLVIGRSANTEPALDGANVRGIIGPRWDYFTVRDLKFFNLNFGTSGALGDCSHCFHPQLILVQEHITIQGYHLILKQSLKRCGINIHSEVFGPTLMALSLVKVQAHGQLQISCIINNLNAL